MAKKSARNQSRVPQQARSRQRVEQILEAAKSLILAKGCAGLKINELAAQAEVTAGSIYQYFDNKAGIIAALAEHFLEANHREIEAALSKPLGSVAELAESTGRLVDVYYELHRRDPVVRDIWAGSAADKAVRAADERDTLRVVALMLDRSKHLFIADELDAVRRRMVLIVTFVGAAVATAVSADDDEGRLIMDDAKRMLASAWSSSIEPLAR